jgi:hypothetical protein
MTTLEFPQTWLRALIECPKRLEISNSKRIICYNWRQIKSAVRGNVRRGKAGHGANSTMNEEEILGVGGIAQAYSNSKLFVLYVQHNGFYISRRVISCWGRKLAQERINEDKIFSADLHYQSALFSAITKFSYFASKFLNRTRMNSTSATRASTD